MGYGEFGGTGSVNFKVVHEESGAKKEKKGKDDNAGVPGGFFTVVVNGVVIASVPIDTKNAQQVLVIWPPDTLATVPHPATVSTRALAKPKAVTRSRRKP
jgi:hypothetical protein